MTVPGWDPIIQYQATIDRIADLQASADRERRIGARPASGGRGARPRTRLGLWLIRLGRAVAADREAAETALRASAGGLGRGQDVPIGR